MHSPAAAEQAIDYYVDRYGSRDGPKPKDGLPRITLDVMARGGALDPVLVSRGEIIVRTPDAARAAKLLGDGYKRATIRGIAPLRLVRFSGNVPAAQLLDAVQMLRRRCIDASPNGISAYAMRSKACATPEHPQNGHLEVVGLNDAGDDVHVVVIDTGLAEEVKGRPLFAHIDFGKSDVDRLTAVNQARGLGTLLDAAAGHGTFVTGMIRRQAPKTKITMIRALNSDGIATDVEVGKAILAAARLKPHIINMSFGSEDVDGSSRPISITDAIMQAHAISPKTLLIAAAGNDGNDVKTYPAALPNVIAVAGLEENGEPAEWSSYGPWVSVSAPGQGVIGPFVYGTESFELDRNPDTWDPRNDPSPEAVWMGTSFSAPSVSGAIAAEMTRTGLNARDALDNLIHLKGTKKPGWGTALMI